MHADRSTLTEVEVTATGDVQLGPPSALRSWFQERFPISGVELAELTNEPVPNHLRGWWWYLGGTPAYLFVVQIITRILLAFYYKPAPETAYQSVRRITEEIQFGWYIRSVHKWAATLMIGLVLLILLSVLATLFPAMMGPQADPLTTPEVIKPELFFCATFRWLKLFSGTAAVLSMVLIVFIMFAWPFIDAWLVRVTKNEDISSWIGVVVGQLLVGLTTWEALVAH